MPPGTMPRPFSLAEISGVFTKAVISFLIASMIAGGVPEGLQQRALADHQEVRIHLAHCADEVFEPFEVYS